VPVENDGIFGIDEIKCGKNLNNFKADHA